MSVASAVSRSTLASLALTLALAAPSRAQEWKPEPRPFRVPAPVSRTLENGLRVAVFPGLEPGLVQMQVLVPAGSSADGPDHAGLAVLTAQALRLGTSSRTADQLAADVDRLGGTLSATATRDYALVGAACLAADFEAGLELLSDVTINPIFPADALERARNDALTDAARQRSDPAAAADELTWSRVFAGRPYGRAALGTRASLAGVTRDQVRGFHADHYRPDRAVLAIAGDVAPERAFAAAAEWFARWSGHAVPEVRPGPPVPPPAIAVRLLDDPRLREAQIEVGLSGPAHTDPQAVPLSLASAVLTGAADPRRSRLAASAGSLLRDPRSSLQTLGQGGLFSVSARVPADSVAVGAERLLGELRRLGASPPTEAELAPVRRLQQNAFPLQFETLGGLLSQWLGADFYGQGADDLTRLPAAIAGATATDVAAAARRWLDPGHATVVVVGPAARLRPLLAKVGPVEVVMPETLAVAAAAAPDTSAPTREQETRGRELVKQAAAAHGGLERLRGIKDSTIEGELRMSIQGEDLIAPFSQVRKEPGKFEFVTRLPGVDTRQVMAGDSAWTETAIETIDSLGIATADSLGQAGLRQSYSADLVHLLTGALDPRAHLAYRGSQRVAGHDADVVEVIAPDGPRRRLLFDATSHMLVALDQNEEGRGQFSSRRLYRDYRAVSEIQWPFREERTLDGQRVMTVTLSVVKLNSGVEDSRFAKRWAPRRSPRR